MKYVWLFVVIIGIAGIYLGIQGDQPEYTRDFGEYPCFLCASVEPDYEVVVFSSTSPSCQRAVGKIQQFCGVTGVKYGGAYFDGAEETPQKLGEVGLEKHGDFLVVVLKNGDIIKTDTNADTVVQFLSDTMKEASDL